MPQFVEIEGRKFFKRIDKARRIYHRLITGLQIGHNQEQLMRFITLTSTPHSPPIMRSFQILRQRIQRANWYRDGFDGFKMNRYYCLKTKEGPKGVLHIIFWGGNYIPQAWLSWNWQQIHYAERAWIQAVWTRRRTVNGLVGYLIGNLGHYLEGQPVEHMSYGWKWAWLGFCRSWKHVKQSCVLRAVGSLKNKPKWAGANNAPLISFKDRFRNVALIYWRSLSWEPLPTTRKIQLIDKEGKPWNNKKIFWFTSSFRFVHNDIPVSVKVAPQKSKQSQFVIDTCKLFLRW